MTGIVYVDDAQICAEGLYKLYGAPERCEISVEQVGS